MENNNMKKVFGMIEGRKVLLAELDWAKGVFDTTRPIIPIIRDNQEETIFLAGFSYVGYSEFVALFEVDADGHAYYFYCDFKFEQIEKEGYKAIYKDELILQPLEVNMCDYTWFNNKVKGLLEKLN